MVANVFNNAAYESPDIQKYQCLISPCLMDKKDTQMFNPSIIIHFISEQGCGGTGVSPSCRRLLRGWVHPQQVTSSSQHQHVETNNHSHSHSCLRSMWSHQLPLDTRTHADMGRTCKLCTERSLTSGIRTLTFLP